MRDDRLVGSVAWAVPHPSTSGTKGIFQRRGTIKSAIVDWQVLSAQATCVTASVTILMSPTLRLIRVRVNDLEAECDYSHI